MSGAEPLLQVSGLGKTFAGAAGRVTVLRDLSFTIARGRSLAIVGESGSGKTTAALCVSRLLAADAGQVRLGGEDLTGAGGAALRRLRRRLGVVLQNPLSALDPRMTVWRSVAEPLQVHEPGLGSAAIERRALDWLERVGLDTVQARSLPHQLSGGQLQRAVIARALILEPQLVILDEPTSALDVSIQAQVLNLLGELREQFGLSYLFITHNLSLVGLLADEVLVMYAGAAVERGGAAAVFAQPRHPYTAELLAAVPRPEPGDRTYLAAADEPPAQAGPPGRPGAGCAYAARCRRAQDRCRREAPAVATEAQPVACFHPIP
jgi:oligopeptide/dipeptide ABC transporter ATP-binding protein